MTDLDLEISKALALAIGWDKYIVTEGKLRVPRCVKQWSWQVFDYRDWNVIGPIAERYDCFPMRASDGLWYIPDPARFEVDTTPQKVIAGCVINGANKCTP
jgi:hypothetical protein